MALEIPRLRKNKKIFKNLSFDFEVNFFYKNLIYKISLMKIMNFY